MKPEHKALQSSLALKSQSLLDDGDTCRKIDPGTSGRMLGGMGSGVGGRGAKMLRAF